MTTMIEQAVPAGLSSECRLCGEPVLRVVKDSDNSLLLLEPTPARGGLYELVARGSTVKARRRYSWKMFEEHQARRPVHGGGYDQHHCAPRNDF